MAKRFETTPVNGGSIKREAATGRLVEVRFEKGVYRSSPRTREVIDKVSALRRAALRRLADR